MKYLNVNACWLVSNSDYDPDDNHLMISVDACPSFGRYIQYGPSGYITKSLDFGEPKTLYIPGALSMPAGTLYDQCWKDYIADLYSPDTRVVTCKVRWKGRMSIDDLRKFYWFDNCLWRIDKVEDWDMMSRGLTKITFVKVNDESAYATTTPTTDPDLQVTLDTYIVPPQGGTVHFSVVTSDNGPWYAEYDPDIVTMSPDHDSASTVSGTITIGPANADREIPIWFFADPASQKVVITQATATGSVNYLGTSYPGGSASDWIPQAGGTAYFEVYSPDGPWSIAGSRNYMTNPTPSSGQATNSTIVAITFGSNGDVNSRFGTAVLTFGGGLTVQSTQVNQYGTVTVSLSHSSFHLDSGAHIIRFWATVRGGLVTYSYADPYGMIGTTTYNYTASTQEEGRYDYSFTVNVYSNESGSSRNAYILINDANTGTEVARVYIAQDA